MKNKRKILIAEDSPTQAELLKYILTRDNFAVTVASNGLDAWRQLQQAQPNLVITDIMMPEMNGYELCRKIREHPDFSATPVIMLTTLSQPEDMIEGLKCGADNFIKKPYDPEQLLFRISDILTTHDHRSKDNAGEKLTFALGGQNHIVNSDPRQILDLLVSTFDSAIQQHHQLRDAEKVLRRTNHELEKAARIKSTFLTNISHEIRTPMNGIVGMTDLALETPLNEEGREYLATVKSCAESLLSIIEDIIDFSRINSGIMTLTAVDFKLSDFLEEVTRIFAFGISQKGLTLSTHVAPDVPENLHGDPVRLRQLLTNLVSNAVKFTTEGQITIDIGLESLKSDEVSLKFSVSDTGQGIPPEQQEGIFDPFVQADSSMRRQYTGLGLGLSLAGELAALMSGRIWMESPSQVRPEKLKTQPVGGPGSTFYFTAVFQLSRTSVDATKTSAAKQTKETVQSPKAPVAKVAEAPVKEGLRILVAEDNIINQKLAVRILQKMGHDASVAVNGQEAVSALEKDDFDLVLMDVQMPLMDGFEATAEIRKLGSSKKNSVPIIALTAHVIEGYAEKCVAAGMNGYVSKPIKKKQLIAEMARLLPAGEQ